MAAKLLSDMQDLVRGQLEMSTAQGGRIVIYARTERALSVRRIRQLALQHGKAVSFILTAEPQIVLTDQDDDNTPPVRLEQMHGTGDFSIMLPESPSKITKLGAKSAGSTDVYIVKMLNQSLSSSGIDEWLKRPKSLDIHVGKGELRMLVAQPSLSTLSLGRLLRLGQLNVPTRRSTACAGKVRRRRGARPRKELNLI